MISAARLGVVVVASMLLAGCKVEFGVGGQWITVRADAPILTGRTPAPSPPPPSPEGTLTVTPTPLPSVDTPPTQR